MVSGDRLHVTRTTRSFLGRGVALRHRTSATRLRLVGRLLQVDRCGPRIWFQIVPEQKSIKNRIHIDVNASGGRGSSLDTRRERVEAEAARLVSLGATRLHTNVEEGLDHYAVAMTDPEGTSSTSTSRW
jgi:Glyoxalase-like domain